MHFKDLAARNILVNDDLLCKIADFGLTRSVENGDSDGEYSVSVSMLSELHSKVSCFKPADLYLTVLLKIDCSYLITLILGRKDTCEMDSSRSDWIS